MHRLIPLLALLLVACGRAPEPIPGLRDPGAPIYSSAVAGLDRLEGNWQQVGTFAPGGGVECGPGTVSFAGGHVDYDLCLGAGRARAAGPAVPGLAGRFGVPGMADWWVLWIDADDRTALFGTPGGAFGFVLNRGGALPNDRLKAVRDIATFNGYRAGDLALF